MNDQAIAQLNKTNPPMKSGMSYAEWHQVQTPLTFALADLRAKADEQPLTEYEQRQSQRLEAAIEIMLKYHNK